jgi:beta-mannosidase
MEHYRRRKPLCGGSLYWNLYDNWPQFSDAAVDYYQNPKIAYYYVGRAFANHLVSFHPIGEGLVGVWLVNDELKDRTGKLLLRCQRLDGGTAWTRVLPARLPANSSRMVWDMRLPGPLMEEPRACFAQAQLIIGGRPVSESFHFPAEFRDIEWPETWLSARLTGFTRNNSGTQAAIVISSALYGRLVRIETPEHVTRISDNFFDIPPGEERTVRVTFSHMNHGPFPIRVSSANCIQKVELAVP